MAHLIAPTPSAGAAAAHTAHHTEHAHDPEADMAGLVMGITVRPRRVPSERRSREVGREARRLSLWVTSRDSAHGAVPGYGFVLQEGSVSPAPDSIRRPGTPIVLTRDEPVAITVRNTLRKPVAVHWHGMELESRFDGVGNWSGTPGSVTPPVPPGDSFVVRFTPPRTGTFIYHTHDEGDNELAAGLYGAMLVVEPGAQYEPSRDHIVVLGAGVRQPGVRTPPVPVVNGDTTPAPLPLATPGLHRLRLINISESDLKAVRLADAAGEDLPWRIVGKDGWTPPAVQQARERRGELVIGVGETYDLTVDGGVLTARGGGALHVETRYYPGWKRVRVHETRVPLLGTTIAGNPDPASSPHPKK
jgi:FtsP/CotA-like multicopper oxidase with cupredoxin domain